MKLWIHMDSCGFTYIQDGDVGVVLSMHQQHEETSAVQTPLCQGYLTTSVHIHRQQSLQRKGERQRTSERGRESE